MDELLKELERTGNLTSSVSFFDVATALFLSFAVSLVLGWVYRATHKASDTAQSAGRWAREHLHDGTDAARRTAAAARRGGRYVSREGRRLVEEGSSQFMTTLRE